MSRGFLVIEALLAAAIFAVFGVGMIVAVISGWNGNRLAEEVVEATQYASQGMEAARSIKNRSYANLIATAGTGIIKDATGVWTFGGSNNSTDSGRFTRVISIDTVNRLAGNIVPAPTGAIDPNTKKITSTVNWNFTTARPSSVAFTDYLTDWKSYRGGVLVYGDGTTTPKYRNLDAYALAPTPTPFAAASNTVASIGNGVTYMIRTSPAKNEAMAGFVTATGSLNVMCFDGISWTSEWNVTVGGTGTTRRFDIVYESNSGDVIVLYSTNTATTNELAFRTKPGTTGCGSANWAAAQNFNPVRTSGIVQWVKMAADRRSSSNKVMAIWADANADLSAAEWTGSGLGNEPTAVLDANLEVALAAQDVDSFDVDYESVTGDAMLVWSSNGNNATGLIKYRKCTAGTPSCTWQTVGSIPTANCAGTNMEISANPVTNEIVAGAMDNGTVKRLCVGYWSGSTWTGLAGASIDNSTATPLAGTKLVATSWLISGVTTRSIIVYNDSATTTVGYFACNAASCAKQTVWTPAPILGNPQKWYDLVTDPFNKDRLIFFVSDRGSGNRLFAKKLVMSAAPAFSWVNIDSSASLGTLGQTINSPYDFAYWQAP